MHQIVTGPQTRKHPSLSVTSEHSPTYYVHLRLIKNHLQNFVSVGILKFMRIAKRLGEIAETHYPMGGELSDFFSKTTILKEKLLGTPFYHRIEYA